MPPLVSVIIPSRNYAQFLPEAIASVFAQGIEDVEVIVVDDGSTDDTPSVLRNIRDPRVWSTRLPGNGISAARNAGLDHATGRYIAFLDADDRWLPGKLQRQVALLEAEPEIVFVFTDFYRFDQEGRFPLTQFAFIPELVTVPTRPSRAGEGRVLEADPFVSLVTPGQFPTWVQTCLIRHEVVRTLRYDEHVGLNQDQHYMVRVYPLGGAAYLPEPLVEVRRHDRNTYSQPLPKTEADARILTQLLTEPLAPAHRAALRRRVARAWAAVGYHHFWHRAPLKSAIGYFKSLRYPGRRLAALGHLAATPLVPFLSKKDSGWIEETHRLRNQSSVSRTNG